jgi:hypothetical protein
MTNRGYSERDMTWVASRVVLIASLLAACNGSGGPGGTWDVPEVDRQIILPWLLCTDCIEGELDKVVARGDVLVPYLSSALLEGPTRAEDSLAQMRAKEAVVRAMEYRGRRLGTLAQLSPAESLAATRAQHDAFRLKYRLRAAQALQRLDSARAHDAVSSLCNASPIELRRNPQYRASFKSIGDCP